MTPDSGARQAEGGDRSADAEHEARTGDDGHVDPLLAEIDRVRGDAEFTTLLDTLVERDEEILGRLAE